MGINTYTKSWLNLNHNPENTWDRETVTSHGPGSTYAESQIAKRYTGLEKPCIIDSINYYPDYIVSDIASQERDADERLSSKTRKSEGVRSDHYYPSWSKSDIDAGRSYQGDLAARSTEFDNRRFIDAEIDYEADLQDRTNYLKYIDAEIRIPERPPPTFSTGTDGEIFYHDDHVEDAAPTNSKTPDEEAALSDAGTEDPEELARMTFSDEFSTVSKAAKGILKEPITKKGTKGKKKKKNWMQIIPASTPRNVNAHRWTGGKPPPLEAFDDGQWTWSPHSLEVD